MGHGAHSTGLDSKNYKKRNICDMPKGLWYYIVDQSKISLTTLLQKISIEMFWLNIDETPQTFWNMTNILFSRSHRNSFIVKKKRFEMLRGFH